MHPPSILSGGAPLLLLPSSCLNTIARDRRRRSCACLRHAGERSAAGRAMEHVTAPPRWQVLLRTELSAAFPLSLHLILRSPPERSVGGRLEGRGGHAVATYGAASCFETRCFATLLSMRPGESAQRR